MADDSSQDGQQIEGGATANGADNQPQVGIITQYVKDLSFENPNAPASFQLQEQPRIDVSVNVGASRPAEEAYEVTLKIDVKASAGDTTAFAVELVYAGLFGLRNVPEEAIEPFLLIEAPRLLFPFARNAVANAIRDGGFPQLLLEPIDFAQLYTAQRAQAGGDISALDTVAGNA
jgi:preprotein translocase subunit SecB